MTTATTATTATVQHPSVRQIRRVILETLFKRRRVSMSEVYEHAIEPADLDMYEAFRQLLAEGAIRGPKVDAIVSHETAIYTLAS